MEYKNQTENHAFQEMLQAVVKRLQNRSGEDLAAKSGAIASSRNSTRIVIPSVFSDRTDRNSFFDLDRINDLQLLTYPGSYH